MSDSQVIKQPDKVSRPSQQFIYDMLCMDLEWLWLEKKDQAFLCLRLVDAPGKLAFNRAQPFFAAPDVVAEMQDVIAKSKQASIWERDWIYYFLWADSLDEGLTVNAFAEAHAVDEKEVARMRDAIPRIEKRWKRLAEESDGRVERYARRQLAEVFKVSQRSFLDAVAQEVVRASREAFGWPEIELERMRQVIASGDEAAVRAVELVTVEGSIPGTKRIVLLFPDERGVIDNEGYWIAPDRRYQVFKRDSLLSLVEAAANAMHNRAVSAGIKFDRLQ